MAKEIRFFGEDTRSEFIAKIKGKQPYIYGFNPLNKMLFNMLWQADMLPKCIVIDENQKELAGIRYLNTPIITLDEFIGKKDDDEVLVVWENLHNEKLFNLGIQVLSICDFFSKQRIIAYGAGYWGCTFVKMAQAIGLDVDKICDRDSCKQGKIYEGVSIISPAELLQEYKDYKLVVTLDKKIASQVGHTLAKELGIESFYVFNNETYLNTYVSNPLTDVNSKNLVIHGQSETSQTLRYYIHKAVYEGMELVLWGNREEMLLTAKRFSQIHVPIKYCIGYDAENMDGLSVRSPYDLAYENADKVLVLVFRDYVSICKRFLKETGLDERMFCKAENHGAQPHPIWRGDCLDPVLGHNEQWHDSFSVMHAKTKKSKGAPFRLGIVGASTSDMYLNPEISWPLQLIDIADAEGIPMEIYDGAVGSYGVSHELIKLVRDLTPMKLDLVISYSGVNNSSIDPQGEYFASAYQKQLFSYMARQRSEEANYLLEPVVYYGHRWDSVGEFWLHQERLMHGVCKELGIDFLGIFQPWLYNKVKMSQFDLEIIAHNSSLQDLYRTDGCRAMDDIYSYVRKSMPELPWLVDFSGIFDNCDEDIYMDACHLTTRGNRILAEKMFDLINPYIGINKYQVKH